MTEIMFVELNNLILKYPESIEKIKIQYLSLLNELTFTPSVSTDLFLENIYKIHNIGQIIVGITNDTINENFEIIASGTIIIEPKIIRGGKNVGHIEDIVVSKKKRGLGICQDILNKLKLFAKNNNCYKVILDCNDNLKDVYLKNGLELKGIQMVEYF